jgi:sterol 3beta-glucosyltransferase
MKIAILTLGTRGDVQPYAVLGQALKARGHEVTLSTAKNFESLIQSYDLNFIPVEADFQAILHSEEGEKIRKNPFLAKKLLSKIVYPMMADAFVTFYELAKQSDRVLFHIKTMADNFADQFPRKMIKADVIPASQPTKEFVNPVFSALHLPSFLNRLSYKLTELGLKMWQKPVNDFRKQANLPLKFIKPDLPSIYGVSELFLSKPADYPLNSYFTGFWMAPSNKNLDERVIQFLNSGDAPILITFGSMPFTSKLDLTEVIKSIVDKVNTRVIVIKGWGLSDTKTIESLSNVLVIDSAPYDKLFPKVKAIVNHGGIGTIAACLLAGKPFLTCPVLYPMGDQYFWGLIGYDKGVSPKPIPVKKVNLRLTHSQDTRTAE